MNLTEPQLRIRFLWKDKPTAQTLAGPISGPSALFDSVSSPDITSTSLFTSSGTSLFSGPATFQAAVVTTGSVHLSAGALITGDLVVRGKVRSFQTADEDDLATLVTRQYLDSILMNFATGGSGGSEFPENGLVTFSYANILYTTQTTTLIVNGASTLGTATANTLTVNNGITTQSIEAASASVTGTLTVGTGHFDHISCITITSSGLASLDSLTVAQASLFSTITATGATQLADLTAGATTLSSLTVNNAANFKSSISVLGTASFASIAVTGSTQLNTLNVSGNSVLASLSAGAISASSVTATGQGLFATIQSTGLATLDSAAVTNGLTAKTLNVATEATFGTTVQVTSGITAAFGVFGGTLSATGQTTLSTLSTSGLATLASLAVTNKATSAATLATDDASTLVTLGFLQSTYLPLSGGSVSSLTVSGPIVSNSLTSGITSLSSLTVGPGSSSFVDGSFSSTVTAGTRIVLSSSSQSDPAFTSVSSGARLLFGSTANDLNSIGQSSSGLWISSSTSFRIFTNGVLASTFGSDGSLVLRAGLTSTTLTASSQATLGSLVVSGSSSLQDVSSASLTVTGSSTLATLSATDVSMTKATISKTLYVQEKATFVSGFDIAGGVMTVTGYGSKIYFPNNGLAPPAYDGTSVGGRLHLFGASYSVGVETLYTWLGTGGGFKFYNVGSSGNTLLFSISSSGNGAFLGSVSATSASFTGQMTSASAAVTNALSAGSLSAATLALTSKGTSASTLSTDSGTTLTTKDFVLPIAGGTLTGPLSGTSASFSSSVAGSTLAANGTGEITADGTGSTALIFKRTGINRFRILVDQTNSDLAVQSYTDAGTLQSTVPLTITRSSGLVTIPSLSAASASFTTITGTNATFSGTGTFASGSFGNFAATGTATLPTIAGNTSFVSTGSIQAATLTLSGAATFNSTISVASNASFSTISTSGLATLNSASVTNALSAGSLSVSGNTSLAAVSTTGNVAAQSLSVATTSNFTGAITSAGINATSLAVTGASGITTTTISSSGQASLNSLSVATTSSFTGAITAGTISAGRVSSSNTTFAATDLVTRSYVDNSFLASNGSLSLSGTLSVAGSTSLSTVLTTGLATLNSLSVSGTSSLSTVNAGVTGVTSLTVSTSSNFLGQMSAATILAFTSSTYSEPSGTSVAGGTRISFGTNNQISTGLAGSASNATVWQTSTGGYTFYLTNVSGGTFTSLLTMTSSAASFNLPVQVNSLTSVGAISSSSSGTFASLTVGGLATIGSGSVTGNFAVNGTTTTAAINASGKITSTYSATAADSASTLVNKGFLDGAFLPLSGGTLTGALNGTNATFSGTITIPLSGSIVSSGSITSTNGLTVSGGTTAVQALNASSLLSTTLNVTGNSQLASLTVTNSTTLNSASISSLSAAAATFSSKATCTATLLSSDADTTIITKGFADSRYFIATGNSLPIGNQLTGYRNAILNLYGDPTYTDYSLQLGRYGSNVSSTNTGYSQLDHRGTGQLLIGCQDAGSLALYTTNVARLSISAAGVISIPNNLVVTGSTASTFTNLTVTNFTVASTASFAAASLGGNLTFSTPGSRIDFGTASGNLAAPALASASAGTRLAMNSYLNAHGVESGAVWIATESGFKIYRNTGTTLTTMFSLDGTGTGNASFAGSVTSLAGTSSFQTVSATTVTGNSVTATGVLSATGTTAAVTICDRMVGLATQYSSLSRNNSVLSFSDSAFSANGGVFMSFTPSTPLLRILDNTIATNTINVNAAGSGFRTAAVNFLGSDQYPLYGLRVERAGAGETNADNIVSAIKHRGLAALRLIAEDQGSIELATTNTTRLTVAANGDINIPGRLLVTGFTQSQFENLTATNFSAANFLVNNLSPSGNIIMATSGAYVDLQAGVAPPLTTGPSAGTKIMMTGFQNAVGVESGSLWLSSSGGFKFYQNTGGVLSTFLTIAANGDLSVPGSYVSTKAFGSANGSGQIYLNGADGNRVEWNGAGSGAPTFTTRSAGSKLVLFPNTSATTVDIAAGVETDTLWFSIPQAVSTNKFTWYGGTTSLATLTGSGLFSTNALTLSGSTGNGYLLFSSTAAGSLGAPTLTNRSVGTKVVLYSAVNASQADGAFGFETAALWSSVPSNTYSFKWYAGSTTVASLSGSGAMFLLGNLQVTGGVYGPTTGSRSPGTRIVFLGTVGASAVDYAMGIESATLWSSVINTGAQFKWYGGTSLAAQLTGLGAFTCSSVGVTGALSGASAAITNGITAATATLTGLLQSGSVTTGAITGTSLSTGTGSISGGSATFTSLTSGAITSTTINTQDNSITIGNGELKFGTDNSVPDGTTTSVGLKIILHDSSHFVGVETGYSYISGSSGLKIYSTKGGTSAFAEVGRIDHNGIITRDRTLATDYLNIYRDNGNTVFWDSATGVGSMVTISPSSKTVSLASGYNLSITNSGVSGVPGTAGTGFLTFNNIAGSPQAGVNRSAGSKVVLYSSGYEIGVGSGELWLKSMGTLSFYNSDVKKAWFETTGDLDFAAGSHTIGASVGANTLTLAGATSTVSVPGKIVTPKVDVGTGGITFTAGAGVITNNLDQYEVGTWTPTVTNTVGTPVVDYRYQAGSYAKVGRLVHAYAFLYWNSQTGGTGTMRVGGLPFVTHTQAVGAGYSYIAGSIAQWGGFTLIANNTLGILAIANGTNTLSLVQSPSGTAVTAPSGLGYLIFSITYLAAS